jgi:MFS transporter, CP family, cyanate transporter
MTASTRRVTQQTAPAHDGARPLPTYVLIFAFALIGLNLRTTFGTIPALLDDIGNDLNLPGYALSLLTAIPVVCMGVLAPAAQRLGVRIGHELLTAASLFLLAVSELLRLGGGHLSVLYVSAFLSGAGMGGVSTVMPGLIGHHLPQRPGLGAGIYSTAMAVGSATAAWVSVPLASALDGWNRSMATWALPTAVTTGVWLLLLPRLIGERKAVAESDEDVPDMHRLPWRSRTAWAVAGYFAIQTFLGFSVLTWVAPAYRSWGWDAERAGVLLSVTFAVQVVAMLILPALADLISDRRPLVGFAVGCSAFGLLFIAMAPHPLAWPAVILFGMGLGGGFAVGLVLLVDYSTSRAEAARLSAMVFLVSYTVSALGPILVGVLHDLTGAFTIGFWALTILAFANLLIVPFLRPGRRIANTGNRDEAEAQRPGTPG